MSRVIAIANQKGGVGKTTTAINLGASLAVAERRTLVIDIDPQANASSGLGLDRKLEIPNIYDVLVGETGFREAIQKKVHFPLLDLVPSTRDLVGAEIEMVSMLSRETVLRRALEPVRDDYDYVLIDCPPSLGLLTLNTLTAADSVLIPIQCEFYALEGLSQLLNTIRLVQRALNPGLKIEGVLLTMFDQRLNLSNQVANDAREYFGSKVFRTAIPRNVRLAEAPSFGEPIIHYDVLSKGAQSYLALAKEVLQGEEIRPNPGEPQTEQVEAGE
jgi:chromosome partitioning protein